MSEINHKDRGHSKLGASSSHRWLACPASIRLSENAPEQEESPYAKEGTAAHELAEACFESGQKASFFIGEKFNDWEVTEEMADYVQIYVDYVTNQAEGELKDLSIEEEFDLSFIRDDMFGTNDACIYEEYGELEIIDLKYGFNEVEAKDNPQLLYYALGAAQGGDYSHFKLTIVQPRLPKNQIKSVTVSVEELEEFEQKLRDGVAATEEPDCEAVAGSHCKYCPAKPICSAPKDLALETVKRQFDAVPIEDEGPLPNPSDIPLGELTKILENKKIITDWLDSVEKHAKRQAVERGVVPSGFKLVRKVTRKKLTDEAKLVDDFEDFIGEEMYEKKLKSISKLEKLIGKKEMESYLTKPLGEIILVEETDKRREISPTDARKEAAAKVGLTPLDT